jgi:hypothetical protein
MFSKKIKLNVEAVVAQATEPAKEIKGASQGYQAPEMHVVGQAGDLVQGNFGYTGRDGQYYYS